MKACRALIVIGLLLATGRIAGADEHQRVLGFVEERAAAQLELESRFDALLDAENLRDWMKLLTARPHHVGSPYGKQNAHWMAAQFESWGFDTRIEVFHVLFPTPMTRQLELVRPGSHTAMLVEPAVEGDETSGQRSEQLPTYNAYSIDGDVSGPLVYVNYGVPEDYDELERQGIDVEGKIVIARYGRSWRGIKPKMAAEKGAIGCILYSDPRDDGFFQGDTYPEGAFKSGNGVQRGSVLDMPLYPGDPLTPFVGATKNAERLELEGAPTLTKIPVLPISYDDALPLLRAIGGPVAPASWRGALPITYHVGPGPAVVRLKVEFSWDIVPAYNVIAMLRGEERPDQWILRGNHHDAWVNGAQDPVSGMVALLEEARAVGELAAGGWKPKRTIVYAAWDAEEPGLLGSTEWVEAHAGVLAERAVAYINSDSNGRGFLGAGGSHALQRFFDEVARSVIDPQTGVTVAARARANTLVNGNEQARSEAVGNKEYRLYALGSGSDYTPFFQHLGISSLNIGYGGENRGGSYHSIYDSFDHFVRFGDPDFAYGITLAMTTGRVVLRLADADVLPLEFDRLASTISGYRDEIGELLETMREETERKNRLIREGHYRTAADPKLTFVEPEIEGPVPHLNLAPLINALTSLNDSSRALTEARAWSGEAGEALQLEQRAEVDRLLFGAERLMTRSEGLPGRPWFRHHVYAPGFYTGYGVKTLPGVREAIELRKWDEAEEQAVIAAEVLELLADRIDQVSEIFQSAEPAAAGETEMAP